MRREIGICIVICVVLTMLSGCISIDMKLPVPVDVTLSVQNTAQTTEQTAVQTDTTAQPESESTLVTEEPSTQANEEETITQVEQPTQPVQTTAEPTQRSLSSLSSDEILAEMATAINSMKSYQGNFSAVQKKVISLNILDCSLPGMTSVVNSVVQSLAGDSKTCTYQFANGATTDEDGNSTTATALVPPRTKQFALTSAGIVSSSAEKSGDNTLYKVVLVAETADYDHMVPTHHGVGLGFLNLAGMDISPAKITKADMQYPGGTVEVTVDSSGRLVSLRSYLPMAGSGTGALGVLSADATFDGYLDETWTFTW